MSRDSKLALIVGFVVFLTAAVLISDHLSRARTAQIEGGVAVEESVPGAPEPIGLREPLQVASNRDRSPSDGSLRAPSGAEAPKETQRVDAFEPQRSSSTRDTTQASSTSEPVAAEVPTLKDLTEPAEEPGPVIFAQGPVSQPRLMAAPAKRRADPQRVRASDNDNGAFASYTVKEGETLFDIAAEHLGRGSRWKAIRDANPDKISSDGGVWAGAQIRIPLGEASGRNARGPAPPPDEPRTYRVQPGDTLSEIALQTFGSVRRAEEILELNREKVGDADMIRVGMELRLPPR